MLVKLCSSVNVCCLDGVEEKLCHTNTLNIDEMGLEKGFGGFKSLSTKFHDSAVWELKRIYKEI